MSRPVQGEYPDYAQIYVDRVPGDDVLKALASPGLAGLVTGADGDLAYAPGKWTVKEVVGHVADTERVFAYRALCLARGERAPLPGFDQDAYVAAAAFNARNLDDLVAELRSVRQATLSLLGGLPAEAWARRGTAYGFSVTVRGLAYVIAGHELHHMAVLRERYGI